MLPQSGFGTLQDFAALRDQGHRLLFRVYTPKNLQRAAHSPSDVYFIAPRFDSFYTHASEPLPKDFCDPDYSDAIEHLDWATRSRSPLISASFSLTWAIWQACIRFQTHVKHDIEIAVIDANRIRAKTGAELFSQCPQESRHPNHWKWYHSLQQAQTVLMSQVVRKEAVLASFPIASLLYALPSYFLSDPTEKRSCADIASVSSFSGFCREVTSRFLRQDDKTKLHTATSGSVALSWTLLQPWISSSSSTDDRDEFLSTLSGLASQVSHWPAHFWVTEHNEIERIIHDISILLVETSVSQRKEKHLLEEQIETVMHDLETILDGYARELEAYDSAIAADPPSPDPEPTTQHEAIEPDPQLEVLHENEEEDREVEDSSLPSSNPSPLRMKSFADLTPVRQKPPSVIEQASFATAFFLFSALTTFWITHRTNMPLIPNIT